ncbi:MAG TPA: ATP-binding protein [Kofleriaceae bacterium]|nr:ATP-binding protein [Kofleriaceae bacterium]
MLFLNRSSELRELAGLADGGGLAVVWGRRRIGKTRLLLEWCERAHGVYTVADQAGAEAQRAYFARAVAEVLPGFADVVYPDWERLLTRLAADATGRGFTGPVVIDELPYLVSSSPELPSVLQRWIDHDAKRARLQLALAGSSQRMMQGLVLGHEAPLFGRARALLDLQPLGPEHLRGGLGPMSAAAVVEHWAAWGGVPRYWELAATRRGPVSARVVELALAPTGPLFSEPERLLLEETPSAIEMRPVLDAIGGGAHRLSEIAGRLAVPATSLGRPLDRLVGMGFVRREVPYGEPARSGKRSLYKLDDSFLRLWFRVVAPNRAALVAGNSASRAALLAEHWAALLGNAWEDLCRRSLVSLRKGAVGRRGPWRPAMRYWHGNEPEWDLVADALEGSSVLVGEAWFSSRPVSAEVARREASRLASRPLPAAVRSADVVRALFVPALAAGAPRTVGDVHLVTLDELIGKR